MKRAIHSTIGCPAQTQEAGIDCGIDAAGNLVVFEANASVRSA